MTRENDFESIHYIFDNFQNILARRYIRDRLVTLGSYVGLEMLNSKEKSFFAKIGSFQGWVDFKVDLFLFFSNFGFTRRSLFWAEILLDWKLVFYELFLYWSEYVVD